MTQRPYTYTVLRYTHDPRAGETLNVGVVLHVASEARLLAKVRSTFGRVKHAFPDLDGEAFKLALRSVERGIQSIARDLEKVPLLRDQGDAASLARRAMPEDDSSLHWSSVGSGITDDPDATLDRLYERLVRWHDEQNPRRRGDEEVWRPVRDKLASRGVDIDFQEKTVSSDVDAITFRHAWKNGRWHVYEPVSFDLADKDGIMEKARRWVGHLAAVEDGAPADMVVHMILGAPHDPALLGSYEKARALLGKAPLHPEVVEEDQVDRLVDQIEDEFRTHSAQH